jgi:hypothetical protein
VAKPADRRVGAPRHCDDQRGGDRRCNCYQSHGTHPMRDIPIHSVVVNEANYQLEIWRVMSARSKRTRRSAGTEKGGAQLKILHTPKSSNQHHPAGTSMHVAPKVNVTI